MSSTQIAIGITIGLLLYGIVIVVLSTKAGNKIQGSSNEFFVGGRNVSYTQLLGTMIMSLMSTLILVGYAPNIYRSGIGYFSGIVGVFMAAGMYLPTSYRLWLLSGVYNYQTPTDFFVHRFRSKAFGYVLSAIYVICIVPYISVQFSGVGSFIESSTAGKIGFWAVVIVFAAYILYHTIKGGNKSVTETDAVAGYVALAVLIIATITFIVKVFQGTPMNEVAATIQQGPSAGALEVKSPYNTALGCFGLAMAAGGGTLVWPHFMQRAYMARSEKVMHFSAVGMALGYLVIMGGVYFWGAFVAPYAFPNWTGAEAENLTAILSSTYAPFLAILIAIGVFAFGLSTADSFAVTCTSLIQKNLLHTKDEKIVSQSKIWLALIIFATLLVTYFRPPILVTYAYNFCSPGFAQLLPSLFFGLFWKRATKEGALSGLIVGFGFVIYTNFINNPWPMLHVLLWGLFSNIIVFVIVSLLTQPDQEAVDDIIVPLENFFKSRMTSKHKAVLVYMAVLYIFTIFIVPYLPAVYIGWMPLTMAVHYFLGFGFALAAFLYGKYSLYEPDGSKKEFAPFVEAMKK